MVELLQRRPDIDAVFAQNDQMALGALRALHRAGRAVPHDVAVAGFDNQPESAFFWPALTTVFQPLVDVGCIAVQELHKLIEARQQGLPREPASVILLPELVIRESTSSA
jgi:LacI family transcriptional regulator